MFSYLSYVPTTSFGAPPPRRHSPAPKGATCPAQRKKVLSKAHAGRFVSDSRAGKRACWSLPRARGHPALAKHQLQHSATSSRLGLAETLSSTALLARCAAARPNGVRATRVGRCREGDSGSQRPKPVASSADEMTASSRRTRWRHRREPATRACGAHGKFVGCASGEPRRQRSVHS